MQELLSTINDNLGLFFTGIGLLLGIIENIKKLPFKPITKILQWIGNHTNTELNSKIDQVIMVQDMTSLKLSNLEKANNQEVMDRIRYTIVRFESDLRNLKKSDKRSHEEFIAIFDMIDKYDMLVKKNNITNNKFEKAKDYINKVYNLWYEKVE